MRALSAPRPAAGCGASTSLRGASLGCRCVRAARPARPPPPVRALGEDFESDNPQNVPPPERTPSPSLSPDAAVRIQLEAAARNDTPRVDHGVHTLYDFCADAGDMDRSRYFGHSKDLYHLDHFLGIKALYPELFRNDGFELVGGPAAAPGLDGLLDVRARVRAGGGEREFVFRMMRRSSGSKAGCWLVKQLLPADSKWLEP